MTPADTLLAFYRLLFGGVIAVDVMAIVAIVYAARMAIEFNRQREQFNREIFAYWTEAGTEGEE